jgi:CHAT domain-containing protein
MKSFHIRKTKGDFIGFAPVSFNAHLGLPELRHSALSLAEAGAYYNNTKLFTQTAATRTNFIEQVSDYSIVNVFSHALADTGNAEPVLYMQDSVINLSELQLLSHPATQLIMLSACQTNVGKNATGEGVYSLARGFSSAGIPSVSATLWKADEETIYAISNTFHALLSKGMRKDEALQKAKLLFMESGGKEKLLPYYWANMIIMGSADTVVLSSPPAHRWWLNAGIIFAAVIVVIILLVWLRRNIN